MALHSDHATDEYTRKSARAKDLFFERFKMALYEDNGGGAAGDAEEDEKAASNGGSRVEIKEFLTATNGQQMASRKVLEEALRFMAEHAMSVLRARVDQLAADEVQWIVTVPAIWSDRAKSVMKRAAVAAGMVDEEVEGQLVIAFEPDCASLSIQHEINEKLRLQHRKERNAKRQRLAAARNAVEPLDGGGGDDDGKQHEVECTGICA